MTSPGEHSPPVTPEATCRYCRRPILRCDTLPSHCGCSSGWGWIHAEPWWGHSCGRYPSRREYARPEAVRDELDDINDAVAGITDAEVEVRLRATLAAHEARGPS